MPVRQRPIDNPVFRLVTIGLELVLYIGVCGLLGFWLDRWLGSAPWLLLAGLLVGLLAGGYRFIRTALAAQRADSRPGDAVPRPKGRTPDR